MKRGALQEGMSNTEISDAGRWLRRRDAWVRLLVSNPHVSKNAKVVGVYIAFRMSAKRPFTYPAAKTMAKDLDISSRHTARALKELEDEDFIKVRRQAGRVSVYSLDL